ncbi:MULTISPECIES: serine hydrolase [Sphingobium]|uniref:beta-lactamase n=1 Tax=Sphingobium chungbukense TaxID=56193 RepID=A0A0M3AXX1_9SPHN|nr:MULTISPECIES: serine hydrolase [Sphingobium]KKW93429.1 beta-lactamase [Sphingobium chungbukense]PJG47906.1 serine hydrolase [Sphingobium sp. LB126]
MTMLKGGRGKRPNGGGNSGSARLVLLMAALSACVSAPQQPYAAVQRPQPTTSTYPIKPVANPPKPFQALDVDQREAPPPALVSVVRNLGQSFNGKVGIAVRRIGSDWTVAWNGNLLFPQQSVSKLWVSMAFLDAVDRGKIRLSDSTTITKKDLTLFHQPTAALVGNSGWTTTYSDLMRRAMTQSDNTANDTLLRAVGGPDAVRGYLARRYIRDIRFGPGERLLQSTTAGLEWRQDYSIGRNFYAARAKLPMAARQKALDNYLASPPDGAAPSSIVQALAKLKQNDMLSPASSQLLMSIMSEAKTGPQRIKGGVPAGWHYLHKTGTGQELGARSTGFNDIGIMTAPDGTSYAVAVMIGSTTEPIPTRWQLMQAVAKAVAANHEAR